MLLRSQVLKAIVCNHIFGAVSCCLIIYVVACIRVFDAFADRLITFHLSLCLFHSSCMISMSPVHVFIASIATTIACLVAALPFDWRHFSKIFLVLRYGSVVFASCSAPVISLSVIPR